MDIRKLLLTIVLTCTFSIVQGQSTQQDIHEIIKECCHAGIEDLYSCIEKMTDPATPSKDKDAYLTSILNMFVGDGDTWIDGEGKTHQATTIEYCSKGTVKRMTVKNYLTGIKNKVYFTSTNLAKSVTVNSFYKVNSNLYFCSYTYYKMDGNNNMYECEIEFYIPIGTNEWPKFGNLKIK